MKEMFISCLFLLVLFNHTQRKRELEKLEFFRKFGKLWKGFGIFWKDFGISLEFFFQLLNKK